MEKNLREYLQSDLNINSLQANIIETFIIEVFKSIKEAEERIKQPDNWRKFRNKKGSSVTVAKVENGDQYYPPEEPNVTTELGYHLDAIRKNTPADHYLRVKEIIFSPEKPNYSNEKGGKYSDTPDLTVESLLSENAPSIVFEAKPLYVKGDVKNRYLGESGIGCFLREKEPYTKEKIAGMIAYTYTNSSDFWNNEINSLSAGMSNYLNSALIEQTDTLVTGFDRARLGQLGVFHLILNFDGVFQD
tara:strand:+ start:5315 stop:6052 length:738 start_codon:yes stop_codon:yes gene_type:complete